MVCPLVQNPEDLHLIIFHSIRRDIGGLWEHQLSDIREL